MHCILYASYTEVASCAVYCAVAPAVHLKNRRALAPAQIFKLAAQRRSHVTYITYITLL